MAITKAAKKAIKRSRKNEQLNAPFKHALRKNTTSVVRKAKKEESIEAADVAQAYSAIDKAVKKNLIHPNTAARKKARMARLHAKQAA
jgi:small subunit ribosomal protein S20